MLNTADLYLGSFLILSGFGLSLFNLRRLLKETKSLFPAVMISENIILMCIGIAFVSRSIHHINPLSVEMYEIEERTAQIMGNTKQNHEIDCKFLSVLMSYGPFIISLVNSFLSLIIDNYMHYKMVADVKKEEDENTVQEVNQDFRSNTRSKVRKLLSFWKKYFPYIAVALQWIVPVLIALSMYPVDVKFKMVSMDHVRSATDICMAMVDVSNETCTDIETNYTLEHRKYIPTNYLEVYEKEPNNSSVSTEIDAVIKNVLKVIQNLKNETDFATVNVTSAPLTRKPKNKRRNEKCMKVCYLDNKSLLLYMFGVAVVCYFVPITISTIILTKIHVMNVKKPNVKTYVSRELFYNILFWTPVMFDTFLSLMLCSYSMNGMRTSIFNVIANVYQAVKNFMNTQYFKDNTVTPI